MLRLCSVWPPALAARTPRAANRCRAAQVKEAQTMKWQELVERQPQRADDFDLAIDEGSLAFQHGTTLGAGSFGTVRYARWTRRSDGTVRRVAVKVLNSSAVTHALDDREVRSICKLSVRLCAGKRDRSRHGLPSTPPEAYCHWQCAVTRAALRASVPWAQMSVRQHAVKSIVECAPTCSA